jgi:F-type H+-transporting ATPase subunit epsilon
MNENKVLKLKIATQARLVEEKEIEKITIPTTCGVITVFKDHIPLIATLCPGILSIVDEKGSLTEMAVSGGFLELHDNELTILADTAERADEIDVERAEEARKRAADAKQTQRKSMDETQFATILSRLDKQSARLKLAKKYRGKGASRMR